MRRLFLLAILVTLTQPLLGQTSSRIYVYAGWESAERGWIPIFCDGTQVAKLQRGKFFAITVTPGKHSLWPGQGLPVTVGVKAGEDVFARVEQYVEVSATEKSSMPVLSLKPPASAKPEIASLVYVEAKHTYSPLVEREDPSLKWQPVLKKRSKD